jgi:hypothetical protein
MNTQLLPPAHPTVAGRALLLARAGSPPLPRQHDEIRVGQGEDQPGCAVCSHLLTEHDPISLRYCRATQAQALPRNCICRIH